MRTGKIGLAEFLYKCRVPGVASPSCACGWRTQDAKHVLIHCPNFEDQRQSLIEAAGTDDWRLIITTEKGAKAASK